MLRLEDHWVWDAWTVTDGDRVHLFYLHAPRSLGDPGLRHVNASVGHAVSTDCVDWEVLGETFAPSEEGFDDLAIWTGSTIREGDRWRMFYTAISTAGHHIYDQRIGSAVSEDLHHWTRVSAEPALRVDPHHYKTLSSHPGLTEGPDLEGSSETWRDPLVLPDPDGDGWHLLVTARARDAASHDDGVIAHAWSADLDAWEVRPPLSAPGAGFGQLEVLRSQVVDGVPILVFTCHPDEMTPERRRDADGCCTWSVPSPGLLGPWDLTRARPFRADPTLFAAPVVTRADGSTVIFGFHHDGEDGSLWIGDPMPVTVDAGGYLVPADAS
ncbi:glycosyl hydrolase [Intrasporangium sp. YIM S08009]|uniref:glycosyl hydrolase n=1 Tax=Intrasporangium zincisolvens TaxID=3080018 RepID=UPI002B058095|nr:glycosyl hydrolase [Intrasporangium sp. YIM S08009]